MAADTWTVREASQADAAALALIGAATFLETFSGVLDGAALVAHCARHHTAPAYGALLGSGARAWLGEASPGDAPIGYALIGEPDLAAAETGDAELKRIYILSRYYGSGLGTALLRHAIEGVRGHKRLLLGVYAQNSRAIAFYRKHGFVPIGDRQFDVGGTLYPDTVLARPLTS